MVKTYSLATDGNTNIAPNFKIKEFKCKDGSDEIKIDDQLVCYLQAVRNWANDSVTINSAYRTVIHNAKVGGASKSYHLTGQASDIVVRNKTVQEVAEYLETLGVKGIIKYDNFVHLDTRTTKYYAVNHAGSTTAVSTFQQETEKSLGLIEMIISELEKSEDKSITAGFETKEGYKITVNVTK